MLTSDADCKVQRKDKDTGHWKTDCLNTRKMMWHCQVYNPYVEE